MYSSWRHGRARVGLERYSDFAWTVVVQWEADSGNLVVPKLDSSGSQTGLGPGLSDGSEANSENLVVPELDSSGSRTGFGPRLYDGSEANSENLVVRARVGLERFLRSGRTGNKKIVKTLDKTLQWCAKSLCVVDKPLTSFEMSTGDDELCAVDELMMRATTC